MAASQDSGAVGLDALFVNEMGSLEGRGQPGVLSRSIYLKWTLKGLQGFESSSEVCRLCQALGGGVSAEPSLCEIGWK